MKVQIINSEAKTVEGISAKTNKAYKFRTQEAWAFTLDRKGQASPYPTKFELMIEDDQQPYPVGDDTIAETSFYVDRFGRLGVSPRLERVRMVNPAAAK